MVAALAAAGAGGSEDDLLARVYFDTPKHLHGVARRSLRAHLLKLEADGRAARAGEHWRPVGA